MRAHAGIFTFSFCLHLVPGALFGRSHLCVFIPITHRTPKDGFLARAALNTWATQKIQLESGSYVRFISVTSTAGTELEPHTMYVPGDVDTDYRHLPVRILTMWKHLGQQLADTCDWFLKADPDTYVNLRTLSDRFSCLNAEEEHFLGVVHAAVPPPPLKFQWPALYFGQGGSGYAISRGLIRKVGEVSGPCLEDMLDVSSGSAMEDVIFALCLKRRLGIEVKSFGFMASVRIRDDGFFVDDEMADVVDSQEIVVNFHQARDELLEAAHTGEPLQRQIFWDAQPPPLHGCIMIAHPVENASDLYEVHSAITAEAAIQATRFAALESAAEEVATAAAAAAAVVARTSTSSIWGSPQVQEKLDLQKAIRKQSLLTARRSGRGRCVPAPLAAARQAEVRIAAPGSHLKVFWTPDQLRDLDQCLIHATGPSPRCEWDLTNEQCYGLSHYRPALNAEQCAAACCRSGSHCTMFQFRHEEGCWLGSFHFCQIMPSDSDWQGGVKISR
mmetsp:Transcript_50830/g.91350  ORF Transcript_50830/g.91350 Transcript_50830/m.91350 type:complete len:501 (+) Transcript_50830:47-1549(+)